MSRLAIASALVFAACGGSSPAPQPDTFVDGGALQMNDVSILFPMGGTSAQYLAASASGPRGTLFPAPLYEAIGHVTGSSGNPPPGGSGDAAYADLHVVALRIDPCFAALAPDPHGAGCTNQLRLVFQEVKAGAAFDSALHVFYALTRDEVVELANAIASVRAANSSGERLGGLAPHPIMVKQGLDGGMADSVRKLVLRYAGAHNLTRVTKLSATNTGFAWSFSGFDVADASAPTVTPMAIPTVAAGTHEQSFFRGFANASVNGQFQPATTSADNLVPLADETTADQLTPSARQTAFDGLARIDNPAHDSPDTIDCASCHLATPIAHLIAQPKYALVESDDAFAFHADGVHVLASELGATFDASGPFQVHAFSYVGTTPAINQRVVNETAAIVAYLSQP